MRWLLLSLLLLVAISRNGGFYLPKPTVLSTERIPYRISFNDLMVLTKCEKEIKFNDDEEIFITYLQRSYNANVTPSSDVLLELSTMDTNNVQHALNIFEKTSNMTQLTLHGHSITISLGPSYCDQHMMRIVADFEIIVSAIRPSDQCLDPGTLDNSLRIGDAKEFIIGTNFRFSCLPGYTLSGPENITCVRDPSTGVPIWTGSNTECVKRCEKPIAPRFGNISEMTSNDSVSFVCQKPFALVGPQTIKCLHDGAKSTWNDFPPKCIVTTCPVKGAVLTASYESDFIATPGFPGNIVYSNMSCKWDIKSRNNTCIHIYFETLDIPNDGVFFEIHKYDAAGLLGNGDLVWSSRNGGEESSRNFIVCDSLLRVSYSSEEKPATGHSGIQMWYLARPVSEYHAAYQRAAHVGFIDQVSIEPTRTTGQTEPDHSSDVDVPAIAAGVTVTVIVLIIAGVAFYIWYRKKYPVRMIIGKDFGKFTNPAYSRKTSTATLTRQDSFEKEIQKMSAEKCVSHDNHVDLSDEQEYQPTSGLTLLGSLGLREGLDDLDSPEMKKRTNTKQRRKVLPGPKVVIEEEDEEEKGEVTKISDSSSSTSETSSTEEKDSASDENSDGEGFRPVTDAPKIKRKRISTYLNEVLDRQNSQDSSLAEEDNGTGVISDTVAVPDSVEVVVHTENPQMTDKEMPDDGAESNSEMLEQEKVSSDGPSASDVTKQNEMDENAEGFSKPDGPLVKLEIQGLNFTDDDDDEGSQSSTGTDEDNKTEELMKTQNNLTVKNEQGATFTTEEIMTEVNNLLQQETKSSAEGTNQSEPINESWQERHIVELPEVMEGDVVEAERGTASEESNAVPAEQNSDAKEVVAVGVPDVSEISGTLSDFASETKASSGNDAAEVNPVPSLLDEIQLEGVNFANETNRVDTYDQMSDMQPRSVSGDITTERALEKPEYLAHKTEDHSGTGQDIEGYLTRDEMRELTARTKSFGEDSLSSVYSGEIVEEDHPVAEIAEQDYYSSNLSLDETDSLEIPYKNKAEVQFEKLIQDIEQHSNSFDVEEGNDITEKTDQEDDTTHIEQSVISFDSSPFDGIPNTLNGETSDFLSLVDNSEGNDSQTLTIAPSSSEMSSNSSSMQPFFDFSSFEDKSSSAKPTLLSMSGFDIGESSTDEQNQLNVLKISPNEQLLSESSDEGDSDDSKESDGDLIEYIVNPVVNGEGIADEEEDDDQIDELPLTIESGGNGRRKSVTLDNPSFDTLDFSKFQQGTLDTKQDESDNETVDEIRMKPSAVGRRESVSLDNPFFDTEDKILPEPQQKPETLRVIQVSNLLVTPPISSSESSSDDSESETGSGGEYQVNPPSDPEDADHKTTSKVEKELNFSDLPAGVVNFMAFDAQSEGTNATENKPTLSSLSDNYHRERTKLEPVESDASSIDSATLKEIEDMSSDSEASNRDHGVAPSTASASAPKKFSLSSISRKFKSSFKTTAKPDLQPGDSDMVDV